MKNAVELLKSAWDNGEPTFSFRAKDRHTLVALSAYYVSILGDETVSDKFKLEIENILDEFHAWQTTNPDKVKSPD